VVSDEWVNRLAEVFAKIIREMAVQLEGQTVVYLDISCFAWHGLINLSLLTAEELDNNPTIGTRAEVAVWRFFACDEPSKSWSSLGEIGHEMRLIYEAENEKCAEIATKFVQICATVAQSQTVESALKNLTRDSRFQVWVFHPDE